MDLYASIYDLLLNFPLVKSWPEMCHLLQCSSGRKPRNWQLPVTACKAVGGNVEQALPVAAAIACLQISIILIDDMLDDDPRGEYHCLGEAATANMAAAFQAIGLQVIMAADSLKPSTKQAITQSLNQMVLTIASGQYLDAQNPVDEAGYWHLVKTKSAPFFGTALQVGALSGLTTSADSPAALQLRRLGELYGEMIQIHDDLSDAMAQPANSDWLLGRSPLPILFAKSVNHPHQAQFRDLCNTITEPPSLAEAQSILIHCGAVSYCIDQLICRYQQAKELLIQMSLSYKTELTELLTGVIEPVRQMFHVLGEEPVLPITI